MRLAFCFISNDLGRMYSLAKHFRYDMAVPPYIIDSFTLNILTNPPLNDFDRLAVWNIRWKFYHSFVRTDFFSMRQDSLDMGKNFDFIYVGDDDFNFDIEASKVINECCVYLKENPDCGAILLGANFGGEGEKHGEEIYITNNGHLNTNRGILVRNRERLMDSRFHALGAMEDSIISFTCLLDGYYIARRLHVPIHHIVERNTLRKLHSNINYDLDYIKKRGIWAKVVEHLGPWEDQNIWPKGIWKHYRQAAMINGRKPRYTPEGEIDYGTNKS